MFLITNRVVDDKKRGIDALGDIPNPKGPLELRMAEATRQGKNWRVSILPDTCTPTMLKSAGIKPPKDAKRNDLPVSASRYVAYKLLLQLKARQKKQSSPGACLLRAWLQQ